MRLLIINICRDYLKKFYYNRKKLLILMEILFEEIQRKNIIKKSILLWRVEIILLEVLKEKLIQVKLLILLKGKIIKVYY